LQGQSSAARKRGLIGHWTAEVRRRQHPQDCGVGFSADKSSHVARLPARALAIKTPREVLVVFFIGFNGRLSPRQHGAGTAQHLSNGVFRRMTAERRNRPKTGEQCADAP
jgi:hypothetical protein